VRLRSCTLDAGNIADSSFRDQIAINGLPISEELFSRYFWRFWNKLREAETPDRPESYRKPSYLFFIFCLTMIIFIEEGVDVAVIEVFCGGRSQYQSRYIVSRS
jgi:folylpolyglutamate synthase